jgi:hypothetical protein
LDNELPPEPCWSRSAILACYFDNDFTT